MLQLALGLLARLLMMQIDLAAGLVIYACYSLPSACSLLVLSLRLKTELA